MNNFRVLSVTELIDTVEKYITSTKVGRKVKNVLVTFKTVVQDSEIQHSV